MATRPLPPQATLPPLRFQASPNRSSRAGARVRLFVWHETVGPYLGSIAWLCNPRAQASAHVVEREDGKQVTQLVPWSAKAWHVAAYNSVTEGNELAHVPGRPWPTAQLLVAARACAFRLHKRGLPPRYARFGIGVGFCRHRDLGAAGGGHVDPTMPDALWKWCVWRVKLEAARGHFRPVWGIE